MRLIGFLDGATPSIGAVREGRSVARLAGISEFYAEPSAWLAGASSAPVTHGVGFRTEAPRYLHHGDWVEAEVEGIGVLSNRIVAHPHAGTPAAELTSR